MSRASKHLIQSKIQTKRHRLRGGEKASRESQKQASKGIFFCGVPDIQTEHSPLDTDYKDYKHQEANPIANSNKLNILNPTFGIPIFI